MRDTSPETGSVTLGSSKGITQEQQPVPLNTVVTISGGNGEGVPPVPIPNTEVKPFSADGTWLDTARKSRSPPDSIKSIQEIGCSFFAVGWDRDSMVFCSAYVTRGP